MNTTTKAIILCAAAAMAGCGRGRNADEAAIEASSTNAPVARAEFTIPKSLVLRMYEAADEARIRAFPGANIGDPLEFAGLSAGKIGEAAFAAKDRPRMEMVLADDCNSDGERRELDRKWSPCLIRFPTTGKRHARSASTATPLRRTTSPFSNGGTRFSACRWIRSVSKSFWNAPAKPKSGKLK